MSCYGPLRKQDSSLGEIRGWLAPAPRTPEQQQKSVATLQAGSLYAAVAGGYVTLSPQFAAAILTCASGTFKWAGYTTVTPGGCVPCLPRASSRHQVAVPCPAGSDFDCCYACASGYLLWPSCVPACDITHAYLDGGARGSQQFTPP